MHPILMMKYAATTVLLFSVAAFGPQRGERKAVLSVLTTQFGKPVRVEPWLYEFKSDYVIEPVFSPDGALAKICLEPKDYSSGAYLSPGEYDEFFRLLNPVKPLGRHKEHFPAAIAHGGRSWKQQQFENAYVSEADLLVPASERKIAAVCTYYLRPVTGIVHFPVSTTPSAFALICIDGAAYVVPKEEQVKLRRNPDEEQTLRVAGPTGDALANCHR